MMMEDIVPRISVHDPNIQDSSSRRRAAIEEKEKEEEERNPVATR